MVRPGHLQLSLRPVPRGLQAAPLYLERLALELQALFRERNNGYRLFGHMGYLTS